MTERPDYIRCVEKSPGVTYCGLPHEGFVFTDVDHARDAEKQDTRLQPCDNCLAAFEDEAPDSDREETHPAYAVISIHRVTGGNKRLFGSALPSHNNTIMIRIARASVRHHLSTDWFHDRKELIEVEMSQAQFAELITTPNAGVGTPCTVHSIDGKDVPRIPDAVKIESEKVRAGFVKKIRVFQRSIEEKAQRVRDLVGASKLGKTEKAAVVEVLDSAVREISSNMPFVLDMFQEAATKVVSSAKAEIDAFATNHVMNLGIKALKAQATESPPPVETKLLGG